MKLLNNEKTNSYKTGDIVQLRSGGPKMTVTEIAPSGRHYICKWFAGAKLEDGHFPEEALQEAKEENKKK